MKFIRQICVTYCEDYNLTSQDQITYAVIQANCVEEPFPLLSKV